MAVIKKLLLSTGGGIISPKQQAEQVENTASIFIGLGGTGIDAIRTIKTEVYSRLKPDNPDAVIPTYKHIRFLGVDTTEKTRGSVEHGETNNSHLALDEDEFLFIGDNKLSEKLKNHDILNKVEQLEWFRHEDIKDVCFGKEVPWVRQIGRYLFMNKSQDFANKLSSHIRQAKEDLNGTGLYIHLFAGLSGVTGSGAFLDACYLIKKVAPNATVFGYFFLPDVNLAKISEDNDIVRAFIKRNGYAALQELDYCMQLDKNGGQLSQLYKGELRYVDWKGAPVSLCHIIGAESVEENVVTKSYDYAMNVTSEYVMDFLTKVNGDNFSLDQHLAICSSMMAHLNFFKTISSEVFYAVLGGACAKIPNKEINTYLASALFSKLTNVKDKRPSESDVNRIAVEAFSPTKSSINDIYEEILRAVRKDAGNDYIDPPDPPYDWRYLGAFGNSEFITHYAKQRTAKLYCIEKNKISMDSNENPQSLINKLHKVLYDEITDENKGPNYVYGVMSKGTQFNIVNLIDGLIAENKDRCELELIQSDRILREHEEAYQECRDRLGRLFGNKNRLYNEYLYRIKNVMKHEVDIKAYNAMDELLVNLKEKITNSANGYYKKLSNLFNDLLETFELNKTTLDSINVQNTNDCFAEELISIHEIEDVLDKEVAKLSLDGFMSLLIQHLMKNEKEWLSGEESKIAKLVNDFFVEKVFNNFAEKTIISFLQMKYETTNEEQIKQKVHDEWIKKLATKSSPMFPINSAVTSKLGGLGKFAFVSVPYTSSPIINAAINHQKIDALYVVKPSGLQDRIYFMNCILGIPLCAYLPLEQLEDAQFQSTAYTYGTHYYEGKVYEHNKGKESGFKDWNMLPPVFPIDLITDSRLKRMPNLYKRINEAKELFNKAIECKVLSDKDWYIYDYDVQEKNNIKKLVENSNEILSKLEKPEDIDSYNVESLIKQLDGLSEFKKEKTNMSLPVDGNDSGIKEKRDAIMFDHFFYAPTYMEKVKSILEYEEGILSQIETLRKELKTKKETVLNQAEDIVDFSEAVFSGVISFDGVKMSLERKDDIFEETIILSECGEKEVYPYYSIPLYQGFLNYQKLETDDKQSIRKEVDDLLNKTSSQLSEDALKLKEVLTKEKWIQWIDKAANFQNHNEIISILGNIYKCLKKLNDDNYWIFNGKYDFRK